MSQRAKKFLEWSQARGILTSEQVAMVTQLGSAKGLSDEQAAIQLRYLSEDDLIALYADIYQLRFLKLEDVEIDPEATRHIPARVAHRHALIPIRRSGNTLAVVMADPLDQAALSAAQAVTDFDIIPFAGRVDAIEHAVYLHYGGRVEGGDADEQMLPSVSASMRTRLLGGDDRVGHMAKSILVNREWTWEKFIVGSANEHAAALVRGLGASAGESGSEVAYIWGESGCGKSHLLHAASQAVAAQNPLSRVLLTTAQRFADHLFESTRDGKLNLFRYLYRELDLLLLDDLEWLGPRPWAQQEIADTLQALRKKSKQACLTATEDSATASWMIPPLRAGIEQGAVAGIGTYPERSRLDILCQKSAPVMLSSGILKHLSRPDGHSIREMLNLLEPLVILAAQSGDALSLETAARLLNVSVDAIHVQDVTLAPHDSIKTLDATEG